ncbi:TctA family transporter [Pseudochelatococcus lubricantis]|uniref:TctA family transporter n=1 Tax=Pseudochelatococcus lubricantis TaxID=1538102 RepID=A0ABX0V9U1_9HYPH|nr:tripartite tricarboxylate transporter permease [Pseudochelatococcus lubricantis]NIJ59946.1 TctA family transporter [Pseudochelatococcus lubricantis]
MDILTLLANGFATAFTPVNLFYCFVGVTVGTFIGVLPGVGAMLGIALLLPVTFYLPPETAIIMLAGIYYGGEYGGAITSILVNVPGSTSSAITTLDGYRMAKQGRAAVALFASAAASFIGGSIGIILMTVFSPAISRFALSLNSADYFAIMVLGLVAGALVARGSLVKGLIAVVIGTLFGMIGTDLSTGVQRYAFGVPELIGGLSVAVVAMALFGLPEIITATAEPKTDLSRFSLRLRDMMPTREDFRRSIVPAGRGSALGSILGILPGTGATIASFLSYTAEKRLSRTPERFGHGAIEGVVGPEAANNAAAQTSFIPTLAIGIPGTPTMALMLGALIIQGIQPGPDMMTLHADLFWALIASFWIGNVMLLILNIPLVGLWAKLANIPYRFLFPSIICLIAVGVYSSTLNTFDVYVVLAIGLFGFGMAITGFEAAPFLMGFILGPMMEENLRRAMQLGRGDPAVFFSRPVSLICLTIVLTALFIPAVRILRRRFARLPGLRNGRPGFR